MRERLFGAGIALGAWLTLLAPGCRAADGDTCTLDSDCQAGLVCARVEGGGRCLAPAAALQAAALSSADAGSGATAGGADAAAGGETTGQPVGATCAVWSQPTTCEPPAGVFDAGAAPCAVPPVRCRATGLDLLAEGGVAGLANAANLVLPEKTTEIALGLMADGTVAPGCSPVLAWTIAGDGRNADCTPKFTDEVPFTIPGLVSFHIREASFDPASSVLSGVVSTQELLGSLLPSLRQIVIDEKGIQDDVAPGKASVKLHMELSE